MELRGIRNAGVARPVKAIAIAVLAALTVQRLLTAALVPLTPDEAYYWVWSQALAPGYADHPPMVALWIRFGTALFGNIAFAVRLLGPLAAAAETLLLADAAERLLPGRQAGLIAGSLWNATLLLGAGSIIMTPDAPLLLFWCATLWAMARIATGGNGLWWLAAGPSPAWPWSANTPPRSYGLGSACGS